MCRSPMPVLSSTVGSHNNFSGIGAVRLGAHLCVSKSHACTIVDSGISQGIFLSFDGFSFRHRAKRYLSRLDRAYVSDVPSEWFEGGAWECIQPMAVSSYVSDHQPVAPLWVY